MRIKPFHVYAEDGFEAAYASQKAAEKSARKCAKVRKMVCIVVQATGGYTGGGHGKEVFRTKSGE